MPDKPIDLGLDRKAGEEKRNCVKFSRFSVRPGVKPLNKPIVVRGFDTETGKDGNIIVVACDDGSYDLGDPCGDVLKFLTKEGFRTSFNFFYNLGFDHNGVFRSVLGPCELDNLICAGRARCGKYVLEYIQGKQLKIRRGGKVWKYYDISKFYKGGVSGRLTDVYFEVFGEEYVKSRDASEEFLVVDDGVVGYCIEDAKACKRLAENLVMPANKLVPMSSWFSGATLAKALRKQNLTRPYRFKPSRLQQFAMNAYGGARIEVFKRGSWGFRNNEHLYVYDIRSAYPSVQAELYDVVNARCSDIPEYLPDALHSFFRISVKVDDMSVGPLKYKMKGVVFYPVGMCADLWVDKNELELLMEYDIGFQIKEAAHDLSRPGEKPYRYLKDMYDERIRCKKSKDPAVRQLQFPYKLALNSSYGMLIERIPKKEICLEFSREDQEDPENRVFMDGDRLKLVRSNFNAGQFFNPVHACEVTSAIRCKLYRDSEPYQDHLIKFATDSITFDKRVNLDVGDGLGQYEDSLKYNGIVIGCGVYSMVDEAGNKVCKFRSFERVDLIDKMEEYGCLDKIRLKKTGPIKLKEAQRENYRWFNTFQEKTKKLDINFDHRRNWHPSRLRDFNDLIGGIYGSNPLNFQELTEKCRFTNLASPRIDSDLIDYEAYADGSLSSAENKQILRDEIRNNIRI